MRVMTWAAVIAIFSLTIRVSGQAPALPEFEVADIRVVPPGHHVDIRDAIALREAITSTQTMSSLLSGQFHATALLRLRILTMRMLITLAYKEIIQDQYVLAKKENDYLKGGPSWLDSDQFDLIAKAAPNVSLDEERLMIQSV
jgi:uncharacterized protein (TIGR03435 family)